MKLLAQKEKGEWEAGSIRQTWWWLRPFPVFCSRKLPAAE